MSTLDIARYFWISPRPQAAPTHGFLKGEWKKGPTSDDGRPIRIQWHKRTVKDLQGRLALKNLK